MNRARKLTLFLAISGGMAFFPTAAIAQRTAAPAGTADGGKSGLASLSDDALLSELAGREMKGLLDHAFAVNKVPEKQRQAMLAVPALKKLSDPKSLRGEHERLVLLSQVAAGADQIIAGVDDPRQLMEYAATLIKVGVEPEVNLMEFWGETPRFQKRLEPTIEAVMKMLDKAIKVGKETRDKLAEQLNKGNNNKIADEWTKTDNLVTTAEYTRAMVMYNQAMAIPANTRTGMEKRKKIADEAIEFIQAYDNEESGIQPSVRNRMAKLEMVKHEYGPANDLFESVVSGKVDDKHEIKPPPQPYEQYEARYFSVVCELMQGDLDRAEKGLQDVINWQKQNVKDANVQKQLDAAADMLRYRITLKEGEKAKDPAAREAAKKKGFAVLMELNQKQPQLQPIIAELLTETIGDDVDLKTAELLIVQAIYNRGAQAADAIEEPGKADAATVKHIEQAIEAARELRKRKDPKTTAATLAEMAMKIPVFYEKLDHKVEAANAYMDYIQQKQGSEGNIKLAFNQAGYLLTKMILAGELTKDANVAAAWERFLPIAIDQFKRTQYAYDYARRLRTKNPPKFAEAIKYFRMVPQNDPRLELARFNEMATLIDWIYAVGPGKKPLLKPEEKMAKVAEAVKVADEVRVLTLASIKSAKNETEKTVLRSRLAGTTLAQAELAASSQDWQKVVSVLDGFEDQTAGIPNAQAMSNRGMELRVYAYVQQGQLIKATPILTRLLETSPGGRASDMVLGILRGLNNEYDKAKAAGDTEKASAMIKGRAELSGYLVKWAAENKNEKERKNLYTYRVYDADTQRLYGASLEGDAKTKQLNKAMEAFNALRSPESVEAYKALVEERQKENPQDKTDPNQPDPAVSLGMALVSFDLGDWKTASRELKLLSYFQKLGTRTRTELDPKTGEVKVVPNEQYWEAMYKYYEATRQWAKTSPDDKDAQAELGAVKTLLRRDYVASLGEAGGDKWQEGYEALRKELIPDLDLEQLKKAAPTAPVAAK